MRFSLFGGSRTNLFEGLDFANKTLVVERNSPAQKVEWKDGQLVIADKPQENSVGYFCDFNEQFSELKFKLKEMPNEGRCRCVYDFQISVLDKMKACIASYKLCLSCERLYSEKESVRKGGVFLCTHQDLDDLLKKGFKKCLSKSFAFNTAPEARSFLKASSEVSRSIHPVLPSWQNYDGQFSACVSADIINANLLNDWKLTEGAIREMLPKHNFKISPLFTTMSSDGLPIYQAIIDCAEDDYLEIGKKLAAENLSWNPYQKFILNLTYRP